MKIIKANIKRMVCRELNRKYVNYYDSDSKEYAYDAGDLGSILRLERFFGVGKGYPLQYSCLGNPVDRGAWWTAVHGVTKSWTRLSY